MRRQLIISAIILLFLGVGTFIAILYGKGYRFDLGSHNLLKGTGLLVTTSTPDGASVYIDDHLTTATNNTINLAPDTYDVKIVKDGYYPWEKKIHVEKEVVSKAEALLFPKAPKLESITDTGVLRPVIDPSFTKIAFMVASQSARKNGVYIMDMGSRSLLTLQSNAQQVVDDTTDTFSNANLAWSPDGKNILATIEASGKTTTYLLDATTFNATPKDVTALLASVQNDWTKQADDREMARLNTLKPDLRDFVAANFGNTQWSPDETKILYIASNAAALQPMVTPAIIGADSTQEERHLSKGALYVYDTKEDKNFLIAKADEVGSEKVMWFPDSKHLIVVGGQKVTLREYDGANNTIIYAGPFVDSDVFPWPTADQIVMLTSFNNPDSLPNLYTISLK